jgi:hypothetical protein
MQKQMIALSCWEPGNSTAPNHDSNETGEEIKIQIEAYVEKGLAVHRDLRDKGCYALTYIKSGVMICKYKMNEQQATRWLIEAAKVADWTGEVSFLSGETAKAILEIALIARRIAQMR